MKNESLRGGAPSIPLIVTTTVTLLSRTPYDSNLWTVSRPWAVLIYSRPGRSATVQFIASREYFDSLENNLSKAEVKSIRCVKF